MKNKKILILLLTTIFVLLSCSLTQLKDVVKELAPHNLLVSITKDYGTTLIIPDPGHALQIVLRLEHHYPATEERLAYAIKYQLSYGLLTEKFTKENSFPFNQYLQLNRWEMIFNADNKPISSTASIYADFGPDGVIDLAKTTTPWGSWIDVDSKIALTFMYARHLKEIVELMLDHTNIQKIVSLNAGENICPCGCQRSGCSCQLDELELKQLTQKNERT